MWDMALKRTYLMRSSVITEMIVNAVAGCVATWPMSIFMKWGDGRDLFTSHSRLPPRKITEDAVENVEQTVAEPISEEAVDGLTRVAHFGYGTAVGSLFTLAEPDSLEHPWEHVRAGAFFGLEVWGASYFGLLPALGSSGQAKENSIRVNGVMIVAHVVWGASLGGLSCLIRRQLRDNADPS